MRRYDNINVSLGERARDHIILPLMVEHRLRLEGISRHSRPILFFLWARVSSQAAALAHSPTSNLQHAPNPSGEHAVKPVTVFFILLMHHSGSVRGIRLFLPLRFLDGHSISAVTSFSATIPGDHYWSETSADLLSCTLRVKLQSIQYE